MKGFATPWLWAKKNTNETPLNKPVPDFAAGSQIVVEHNGPSRAERRARQRAGYNVTRATNKPYRRQS